MKSSENSKKRINIIDLTFLIIIFVIIIFVVVGLSGGVKKDAELKYSISYTLEVTNKQPEFLANVSEGQVIYNSITKEEIGKIVSITKHPNRGWVEKHDEKKIEYVDIPNRYDVNIEIEAEATMEKPDIKIGETELKIGKGMNCNTDTAILNGTIIGLEFSEELTEKEGEVK